MSVRFLTTFELSKYATNDFGYDNLMYWKWNRRKLEMKEFWTNQFDWSFTISKILKPNLQEEGCIRVKIIMMNDDKVQAR